MEYLVVTLIGVIFAIASLVLLELGLAIIYGMMGVINLAHGSLAVLSAYALYVLADRFAIEPFLGLLIVAPLMALIGWALQRLVLERSAPGQGSVFVLHLVRAQPPTA